MPEKSRTKTPACVAGLIAMLEMCLDHHDRVKTFTKDQRQMWSWIGTALEVPGVMLACEKLDHATSDYLTALLCDYNAAVFPRGAETEEETTELLLF